MNAKKNKNKIVTPRLKTNAKYILFMIYIIYFLITLKPALSQHSLIMGMVMLLIGFTLLIGSFINEIKCSKIVALILWLFAGIFIWIDIIQKAINNGITYLFTIVIWIISIAILLIFSN